MQRYFGKIMNDQVLLEDTDQFHLVKVMRVRAGEQIEVVADDKLFICDVKSVKPLSIEVNHQAKENNELRNDIILIVSLIKGEKLDFVIQKATELGVEEIVLLQTERSVVKIRAFDKDYKVERFNRIIKEAAEQSKRTRLPLMYRILNFDELHEIEADVKLIAYEGEQGDTSSLFTAMKQIDDDSKIAVLIGPEGGFSKNEVREANERGFQNVSLGRRILRAETASLYTMSVLASYLERK